MGRNATWRPGPACHLDRLRGGRKPRCATRTLLAHRLHKGIAHRAGKRPIQNEEPSTIMMQTNYILTILGASLLALWMAACGSSQTTSPATNTPATAPNTSKAPEVTDEEVVDSPATPDTDSEPADDSADEEMPDMGEDDSSADDTGDDSSDSEDDFDPSEYQEDEE